MGLDKQIFFSEMFKAIETAAYEAMVLYNKAIDPDQKETVKLKVDYLPNPYYVSLNTSKGKYTVDLDKASEVFGKAFAAKITPILIKNIDNYIRSIDVVIPPGQEVKTKITNRQGIIGETSNDTPAAVIR